MDRRETVRVFRERLVEVIRRSGLNHSAFAARTGIDRSTLSQLLSPANDRLPRLETVATIGAHHLVSVDWLLGLSQRDTVGADIVPTSVGFEPDAGLPTGNRLFGWHAEAAGHRIRLVPTSFPDLVKTAATIRYEYAGIDDEAGAREIAVAAEKLDYLRGPGSDLEVCTPIQALEAFARGEGVWRAMDATDRRDQLLRIARLVDELYPSLRWFMFDARDRFAAPMTLFGPHRAALYIGGMYLTFTATEHIRALSQHFDRLIRAAAVLPTEVARLAARLAGEIG